MSILKGVVLSVFTATFMFACCACGNSEVNTSASTPTVKATESQSEKAEKPTVGKATEKVTQESTEKATEKVTEETTEKATQKPTEKATEKKLTKSIALTNEYTTRFEQVNMVTYPAFRFNYPSNWDINQEECTSTEELVTLTNGNGATVTFLHMPRYSTSSGGSAYPSGAVISKVASSQFIPGYVQATDHSSLGEFMVAEITSAGSDGAVSYAVLPVNQEGTRGSVNGAVSEEFYFDYSSQVSFTATQSEKGFTEQEKQEAIAILNSFRLA